MHIKPGTVYSKSVNMQHYPVLDSDSSHEDCLGSLIVTVVSYVYTLTATPTHTPLPHGSVS